MLVGGPRLYRAMGGTEGALAAALMYSNVVFVGAIAVWLFNTLGSVLRGAGNMLLPALVVVAGGPVLVALSPALIWGWGPFPRLDIAGAGVAFVTYYTLGSIVLAVALRSRRHLVRLSLRGVRLRLALFAEILRVGLPGALNTVQTNLTVVVLSYGFLALGLALYFASQGAGRLLWPLVAGFTRLSVAATAGWAVIHWLGGGLSALSVVIALAFVLFGVTLASAVRGGAWRR